MKGNVIHFPETVCNREHLTQEINSYPEELKKIATQIRIIADRFQVDVKEVVSDTNYLVIGADVLALHLDQDEH